MLKVILRIFFSLNYHKGRMVSYIWSENALIYDSILDLCEFCAAKNYNSLLASRMSLVSQIWQRPEAEF
jgi:hypothetical protein